MRPRPHQIVLCVDDSATIRKLVEVVLGRAGHEVHVAEDGEEGLRLAEAVRPDLILLDFVMPKMNGYQLCRALAERPALRDVPVILMSAKGDQIGERFVRVMGITDYLTKPFPPEALAQVVARTLARAVGETTGESTGAGRRIVIDDSGAIEAALPLEADPDAATDATDAHHKVAPARAWLAGELARVPIAEVLWLVEQQRQTGLLEVRSGRAAVSLCFREGRLDYAGAEGLGAEFVLGRYLVRREAMAAADLEHFFASRGGGARLCGEQLVKLGHVSAQQLRAALAEQSAERFHEVLRWRSGRFALRDLASDEPLALLAGGTALGLRVDELLLQGSRRLEEWRLVERELADPDAVFLRNDELAARLGGDALTLDERAVLDLCDARHTVRDIMRKACLGSLEVGQLLRRLSATRLVRRRVPPLAV